MALKVPMPVNGWRVFAGEVGVIVLGVLIALGAQQLADDWHWRQKVDLAMTALRDEAVANDVNNVEAIMVAPCVLKQIDMIERHLAEQPTAVLPRYSDGVIKDFILRMPDRTRADMAWRSINDDETVRHIDAAEATRIGNAFSQVDKLNEENREMQLALAPLNSLSRMAAPTPSDRFAAMQQVERLRRAVRVWEVVARQQRAAIAKAGMLADDALIAQGLENSGTLKFCKARGLSIGTAESLKNKQAAS